MRTLFEMDKKNYDSSGKVFYRPSVRSIIIRGGRVAMVHSLMYDYYKFPGGGIESGETRHQALIRETAEESGLCVVPDSIQEYGCVRRIEKSDKPGISVFCSGVKKLSEIRYPPTHWMVRIPRVEGTRSLLTRSARNAFIFFLDRTILVTIPLTTKSSIINHGYTKY